MTGKSKAKAKTAKKTPAAKKKSAPKASKRLKTPKVQTHGTGVQSITGEVAHSLYITAQTDNEGVPTGAVQVLLKSETSCLGFVAMDTLVWEQIKSHLDEAISTALSIKSPSQIASVQ